MLPTDRVADQGSESGDKRREFRYSVRMTRPVSSFSRDSKPSVARDQAQAEFEREIHHRLEAAERNDLHDEESVFDEIDRLIQDSNKARK